MNMKLNTIFKKMDVTLKEWILHFCFTHFYLYNADKGSYKPIDIRFLIQVYHLFPQAKNRELMKQVAALSKGKKFDRTGSSLLLP